jgi:16S rRNA G966 N2-methylase RsmD
VPAESYPDNNMLKQQGWDMDPLAIRAKFGTNYVASARTFTMGIDRRFAVKMAERFRNRRVLETCTGGGFTTIELARVAAHVFTVEIDPAHQAQAKQNLAIARSLDRVTFVLGDILLEDTWAALSGIDAAFLDPDWAVTGPDHVHRFRQSSTQPPADVLLDRVFRATRNVALVLPPTLDIHELDGLPRNERQQLYMDGIHELYCLYFGDLATCFDKTEFRV